MEAVFADAFYFIARLNRRDQHHARVVAFSYGLEARLVTTELILVEVADALAASRCRPQVQGFVDKLATAGVLVVPATTGRQREALAFYHRHADKAWTLTDCFSFVVMREYGLTDALTGDRHFTQAGFHALLA